MQQAQNFFPNEANALNRINSNGISQTTPTKNYKETPLTITLIKEKEFEEVRYFELVSANAVFNTNEPKVFTYTAQEKPVEKNNAKITALPGSRSFSNKTNGGSETFYLLLICLDQIVFAEEMLENLKKIDAALKCSDFAKISLMAEESMSLCSNCGMLKAVEFFQALARSEFHPDLKKAKTLLRQIKMEFTNFRSGLEERLEKISA